MAASYLNSARIKIDEASRPVEVLVAEQDIARGTPAEELFSKKLVTRQEVPAQFVSSDAISSQRAIEGQVLAIPLSAGEQLTTGRFQYPSAAGLAYSVPENYVAISVPADAVSGVSGLVRPGDHVAVLVTLKPDPESEETVTKTLVPKARILAVDDSTGVESESTESEQEGGIGSTQSSAQSLGPKTFTLAVSQREAEQLVLAENSAEGKDNRKLWMALLPTQGTGLKTDAGVTSGDLIKVGR